MLAPQTIKYEQILIKHIKHQINYNKIYFADKAEAKHTKDKKILNNFSADSSIANYLYPNIINEDNKLGLQLKLIDKQTFNKLSSLIKDNNDIKYRTFINELIADIKRNRKEMEAIL